MVSERALHPNPHLRQQREIRGWSLQEVADQLNRLCERDNKSGAVNLYMVSKWERGVHTPSPFYRAKLCELYQRSAVELGFLSETAHQLAQSFPFSLTAEHRIPGSMPPLTLPEKCSKDRGAPFELTHAMSTSLSIPSLFRTDADVLARFATVLNTSSTLSEREVSYFDEQTRLYWRAREETALPTITLYPYVIRHMDDITILFARARSPMLHAYLSEIVSRTVLLAGILLYDLGQYTKARQQYQVAFQAATDANNSVLQAIIWGWMSFTWTYTEHYTEALNCVQYARSFTAGGANVVVQAWLGAIEAEIQAHVQNRNDCRRALSSMERGIGSSPSSEISYLFEFNPVLLLGYKGVCLQQLYHRQEPATHALLQEARESLDQALASEAPLKRKLYYLNDLAGVYARQGELEMACTYMLQSVPLMMQIGGGSKTLRKHLLQVRALLQPHEQTASVQALDEQMAPLLLEM